MTDSRTLLAVALIALITALLRFLPFMLFGAKRAVPKFIEHLGRLLPAAIMGMLVVYCLKDVRFTSTGEYLPALLSCLVVAVSYLWKRNTLISIVAGTLCNMLLVQLMF